MTKLRLGNLSDQIDIAGNANAELNRLLIENLYTMAERIMKLEAQLDHLSDLTVGDSDQTFEARVLSVIEENSYSTFTHLEAEIDEKLDQMTQSYGFAEAVEEAVKGSIVSTVEDVISELGVIDPEEIVRQGLKAII